MFFTEGGSLFITIAGINKKVTAVNMIDFKNFVDNKIAHFYVECEQNWYVHFYYGSGMYDMFLCMGNNMADPEIDPLCKYYAADGSFFDYIKLNNEYNFVELNKYMF
jgi:hypothetical protein